MVTPKSDASVDPPSGSTSDGDTSDSSNASSSTVYRRQPARHAPNAKLNLNLRSAPRRCSSGAPPSPSKRCLASGAQPRTLHRSRATTRPVRPAGAVFKGPIPHNPWIEARRPDLHPIEISEEVAAAQREHASEAEDPRLQELLRRCPVARDIQARLGGYRVSKARLARQIQESHAQIAVLQRILEKGRQAERMGEVGRSLSR